MEQYSDCLNTFLRHQLLFPYDTPYGLHYLEFSYNQLKDAYDKLAPQEQAATMLPEFGPSNDVLILPNSIVPEAQADPQAVDVAHDFGNGTEVGVEAFNPMSFLDLDAIGGPLPDCALPNLPPLSDLPLPAPDPQPQEADIVHTPQALTPEPRASSPSESDHCADWSDLSALPELSLAPQLLQLFEPSLQLLASPPSPNTPPPQTDTPSTPPPQQLHRSASAPNSSPLLEPASPVWRTQSVGTPKTRERRAQSKPDTRSFFEQYASAELKACFADMPNVEPPNSKRQKQ